MVSVIIVNYNRKDLLKKCLDSVRGQDFKDIEIIVVDNASEDGSIGMLSEYYPEVKVIRNADNLLFCKAQNQGIDSSNGEFVLCLNSDVILDVHYLKEAMSGVSLNAKIGMVSGKILRMDKRTIDSTGLFLGRNRKAVERGYGKLDKGQYERAGYVFGVSGACAFLKKSMLEDIKDKNGYFDERFGMYYEDLDLCWRANKKRWKAYYNPKALAYHIRGGTAIAAHRHCEALPQAGRSNLVRLPYSLKKMYIVNRYKCMVKNDSILSFLVNLPFILWYDIKIWIYFIIMRLFLK